MTPPDSQDHLAPPPQELDFWLDPDPDSSGLLLSDRIEFYVHRVQLIDPFDKQLLSPASYTLRAGKDYVLNKKDGDLEKEGSVLIPPNGLIFIRFHELINIPYYMVARFNLRVKQVYRGLLLGTGPQVDPGFRGHLNCPIHNFTDEPKRIHYLDPLATIDFEKTTKFGEQSFHGSGSKKGEELAALIESVRSKPVVGKESYKCLTFRETHDRAIREYLPPGESVRSSVFVLQQKVEKFEGRLDTYRRIGFLGLLAVLITGANMFLDVYRDVTENISRLRESVRTLEESQRRTLQLLGEKREQVATPQKVDKPESEPSSISSKGGRTRSSSTTAKNE